MLRRCCVQKYYRPTEWLTRDFVTLLLLLQIFNIYFVRLSTYFNYTNSIGTYQELSNYNRHSHHYNGTESPGTLHLYTRSHQHRLFLRFYCSRLHNKKKIILNFHLIGYVKIAIIFILYFSGHLPVHFSSLLCSSEPIKQSGRPSHIRDNSKSCR